MQCNWEENLSLKERGKDRIAILGRTIQRREETVSQQSSWPETERRREIKMLRGVGVGWESKSQGERGKREREDERERRKQER